MIAGLLKTLIGPILKPLIDRIPDKNERARAQEDIERQMLDGLVGLVQGQLRINEQEAKHSSIFVAGWRPWIGWVCGFSLAWSFIVAPLLTWGIFVAGVDIADVPKLDTGPLMTLVLGMLGMGGLRTYEKTLGVARKNL